MVESETERGSRGGQTPRATAARKRCRTLDQLEANLRSAGLHLTAAETAALDAASDPHPVDYPYGELGVDQRSRTLGG